MDKFFFLFFFIYLFIYFFFFFFVFFFFNCYLNAYEMRRSLLKYSDVSNRQVACTLCIKHTAETQSGLPLLA